MSIREYVHDNLGRLLLHLISIIILSTFLLLTGTSSGIVLLIIPVWALILLITLVADFLHKKRKLEELWTLLDGLPEKYLLMECVSKPKTEYERQWYQIMRTASRSMIGNVSAAQRQQQEYREYIEDWVHEIKVPITTIQLICENNRNEISRKILVQLSQVEEQVERSLYYARSEQIEQDFVVQKACLADIVKTTLLKYRTLLIQSGVQVKTHDLNLFVYTDTKWLEFIIGQLLSNAVKYQSKLPILTITAVNGVEGISLYITDNGIGIPPAELTRIFDKGFTGSNGRSRGGATGMGLYLCKKLATHLGISITVESIPREHTSLILHFPK